MPIKPENKKRYPANWKEIRAKILERASNRCEGSPAFPDCRMPNGWYRVNSSGMVVPPEDLIVEGIWLLAPDEFVRIVLTIGHLDHTPENCDPLNLRAWCQRCHLTYDAKHHAENARQTRRARKVVSELPFVGS